MESDCMDIQVKGGAMNYIEQGIKVGDRVWTIQLGEVTVVDIVNSYPYRILVGAMRERYTANGKYWETDVSPSLFWSDPHIVSPPKPTPYKYQLAYRRKGDEYWGMTAFKYASVEDFLRLWPDFSLETHEFRRLDP